MQGACLCGGIYPSYIPLVPPIVEDDYGDVASNFNFSGQGEVR